MTYKAVIFDAGDILYDATPWRKWLTSRLQQLNVSISYEKLVEKWEALLVDVYLGKANYWERFEKLLSKFGLKKTETERLKEDARQKGKDVQIGRKPFNEVPETLAKLKANCVKLAVLSDTESTSQKVRKGLNDLGIEHYFNEILTSFDIGYVKPQPQAFAKALEKLGTEKDETIFVAHDIDELEGALDFGLTVVAYNYKHGAPATFHISNFSDLFNIACSSDLE